MDRCPACPGKYNCVPPDGPEDAEVVFIGEAPGKEEDRAKVPYVGKTGREVNEHYLPLAGLRRDRVCFLNSIQCYPDRAQGRLNLDRAADRDLLISCSSGNMCSFLNESQTRRLIVPMGVLANHVIDPDINLELQHGIPVETSWGTVFPMYHPAGGLHEPKKMLLIRNDYVRLGKYLKGKLHIPQDSYPRPDYSHIHADELLETYLECNDYTNPMACDTEITRFREPYCLTFSTRPGTGRLILAEDTDAIEIFQEIVNRWRGPILFHNWLFDKPVTQRMGIDIPDASIIDTMVRAYHLGNLPQGLKALAYRLLGMTMMDFDDLVTPYSIPLCIEYLQRGLEAEWTRLVEQLVRDPEGNWKLYKPQSMSTKFKRFFTDYSKNPNLDIYERWKNWGEDHQQIEAVLGPWPGKDIRYAPFDKQVFYACRDADSTLRLWPVLERMRRQVRRKLSEHWE